MLMQLLRIVTVGLILLLPSQQTLAHVMYRNIQAEEDQTVNADGSVTYRSIGSVASNGSWANAADANWGNSHWTPWYKFEVTNPTGAYISLSVAGGITQDTDFTDLSGDLTPAFSLYKGLLPDGGHDGAVTLPVSTGWQAKDGGWQALADTTLGNGPGDVYDYHIVLTYDPDTGEVIGAEATGEPTFLYNDPGTVATINYLTHAGAVDSIATTASLKHYFLEAGSYSVALGGTCYECFPHPERTFLDNPLYDPNYETNFQAIEGDVALRRGFSLELTVQPVPVPAAIWLFGSGLLGLLGIRAKTERFVEVSHVGVWNFIKFDGN